MHTLVMHSHYYVCACSGFLIIQRFFILTISKYEYNVLLNIQLICQNHPSTIFLGFFVYIVIKK